MVVVRRVPSSRYIDVMREIPVDKKRYVGFWNSYNESNFIDPSLLASAAFSFRASF